MMRFPCPPLAALAAALLAGCSADSPATLPTTVELAVIAGGHGGAPFHVAMTQEVTHTPVWAGDADGVGRAILTFNLGQQQVCWELEVDDISLPATASHIHQAPAGVRGAIVLPLTAPDATGTSSGCAQGVSRELIHSILTSPTSFYVNVHTSDYPAGAVRGQFGR